MSGDPGFIVFIGLFAFPPLALWVLGCFQMLSGGFSSSFATLTLSQKITAWICILLIVAFSSGCFWFVYVFIRELNIQLNCAGAGCAQTGIFFYMHLPLPWLSFSFAWAAAVQFVEEGSLPLRRKPDFSLNRSVPQPVSFFAEEPNHHERNERV